MDPGAIVAAAADFLWSAALIESIEAFTLNHVSMFADANPDGEQRLEWTEAHRDFSALFDLQLEAFVATQPFSHEDFIAACQAALANGVAASTSPDDPAGFSAHVIETVVMATEYTYFVQAMAAAAADAAARGGGVRPGAREAAEPEGTELQTLDADGGA